MVFPFMTGDLLLHGECRNRTHSYRVGAELVTMTYSPGSPLSESNRILSGTNGV